MKTKNKDYSKCNDKTVLRNWADVVQAAKLEAKNFSVSYEVALHRVTGCDIIAHVLILNGGTKIDLSSKGAA
jgi:hypothetical protein